MQLRTLATRHVLLALLLFGCESGPRNAEAPAHPPRIAFTSSVHTFGEIEQGATLDYAFTFSNRGGVDLTIDKLRSGCNCTATVDVERFVQPGASGRVRVQCDTSTTTGRQRRTVTVYSNDPVTPVAVVRLVGKIRAPVAIAPSSFYVGRMHRGERVSRDGLVRWEASRGPVDVVPDAEAAFRVEMSVPQPTDGDRTAFSLVMKPDAPLGPLAGTLRVRDVDSRTLRAISVVGEIVPDVSVSPPQAVLEAVSGAPGTASGAVLLYNAGVRPVRVTGTDWPLGTVAVDTLDQGTRYRIALQLQEAASGESELVVHTDHPEQPLLRVPVVVRFP